jgi:hypothetical protein
MGRLIGLINGPVSPIMLAPTMTMQSTMEADQINLIGNSLSDLAARASELRRYL